MMERFKAGIGFGIFTTFIIFSCEDIFAFKVTRDGLALLIMAATAFGSSYGDRTIPTEAGEDGK